MGRRKARRRQKTAPHAIQKPTETLSKQTIMLLLLAAVLIGYFGMPFLYALLNWLNESLQEPTLDAPPIRHPHEMECQLFSAAAEDCGIEPSSACEQFIYSMESATPGFADHLNTLNPPAPREQYRYIEVKQQGSLTSIDFSHPLLGDIQDISRIIINNLANTPNLPSAHLLGSMGFHVDLTVYNPGEPGTDTDIQQHEDFPSAKVFGPCDAIARFSEDNQFHLNLFMDAHFLAELYELMQREVFTEDEAMNFLIFPLHHAIYQSTPLFDIALHTLTQLSERQIQEVHKHPHTIFQFDDPTHATTSTRNIHALKKANERLHCSESILINTFATIKATDYAHLSEAEFLRKHIPSKALRRIVDNIFYALENESNPLMLRIFKNTDADEKIKALTPCDTDDFEEKIISTDTYTFFTLSTGDVTPLTRKINTLKVILADLRDARRTLVEKRQPQDEIEHIQIDLILVQWICTSYQHLIGTGLFAEFEAYMGHRATEFMKYKIGAETGTVFWRPDDSPSGPPTL